MLWTIIRSNALLFLLNDRVFKFLGGSDILVSSGMPMSFATTCTIADAVTAMQTAFVESPELQKTDPVKAAALAYLIASKSGANCAMFVPQGAKVKHPHQVAFRLGTVGITVLGTLNSLQEQGRLNSHVINEGVWKKMAA
ncbi:MAG: hypothetical protein FD163_2077 [Hyphomonadaceae bacterium]|nr:MAG: hypothetical protein FD128_1085 [Hyphomonadaceae bacterium]KAF0183883.1 MAG: hypothetical protein FD163_2077 [Hyphomonadaceae bacterium]